MYENKLPKTEDVRWKKEAGRSRITQGKFIRDLQAKEVCLHPKARGRSLCVKLEKSELQPPRMYLVFLKNY